MHGEQGHGRGRRPAVDWGEGAGEGQAHHAAEQGHDAAGEEKGGGRAEAARQQRLACGWNGCRGARGRAAGGERPLCVCVEEGGLLSCVWCVGFGGLCGWVWVRGAGCVKIGESGGGGGVYLVGTLGEPASARRPGWRRGALPIERRATRARSCWMAG